MKRTIPSLLILLLFGCDGASRATVEGDGSQQPLDAKVDMHGKDAGVDQTVKPPPIVPNPEQSPITFIITNKSTQPRYVRWNAPFTKLLRFEKLTGGSWSGVMFEQPFCMASCSEREPHDECLCMDCAMPAPSMKLLRPGESVQGIWSGKSYRTEHYCECGCWRDEAPETGRYKVLVDAFASYQCGYSPCSPPGDDDVIPMAEPEGDALTASVEFSVATNKTRIEVWLQ